MPAAARRGRAYPADLIVAAADRGLDGGPRRPIPGELHAPLVRDRVGDVDALSAYAACDVAQVGESLRALGRGQRQLVPGDGPGGRDLGLAGRRLGLRRRCDLRLHRSGARGRSRQYAEPSPGESVYEGHDPMVPPGRDMRVTATRELYTPTYRCVRSTRLGRRWEVT